ncbi:bifunctional glycosyltransferase/CDP-glycerol:glycerophosphate glycerophosphotransferase [Leucobacter massiliensis]|uniref:Glycosyltransferase 2-like domain-containing protein n=1 Tax=Leucobacter massiliensis TaxID=1686285 RepID=A0A2S9QKU6_9MICO|nr:CDP-glycerol glycerophosphotransferase family protein [Leucobacter massiliensis]PRI10202.1 hypothetical protein B4915_12380 [Leucobacter massiliensis]
MSRALEKTSANPALTARMKTELRRAVRRVRHAAARPYRAGMLSIVVPVYNVEAYLEQCLRSLMHQRYHNVQIIVVDDGSPDGSLAIARRLAREDARIEIVRQPNGGLSAARNTGVRHARGEFLTFIDSDDFIEPDAYARAVASLQSSGSDFAVMSYRREKNGRFFPAGRWIRDAHRRELIGTTLEEHPEIMVNTIATSKVYRRQFWDAQRFSFPEGYLYEDQIMTMEAYAAARAIDFLETVGLNWRVRTDNSSITQNAVSARNLRDFEFAIKRAVGVLEERGAHVARDRRVLQILSNNYGDLLPYLRAIDSEGWPHFIELTRFLWDRLTDDTRAELEARRKILLALCLAGEKELALEFLAAGGWNRDHFGGLPLGDRIVGEFPLSDRLREVLPADVFEFGLPETGLHATLRRVGAGDAGVIRLDFFAHINHLRMDEAEFTTRAWLLGEDGLRTELATSRRRDDADAVGHTRRYADMSFGAASAEIPYALLGRDAVFTIEVEIESGELTRRGELTADAQSVLALPLDIGDGERFAAFAAEADHAPVRLHAFAPQPRVEAARVEQGRFVLTLSHPSDLDEVTIGEGAGSAAASLTRAEPGRYEASFALESVREASRRHGEARLRARSGQIESYPLLDRPILAGELYATPLFPRRGDAPGICAVVDLSGAVLVEELEIANDRAVVTGRAFGPLSSELVADGPGGAVPAETRRDGDGIVITVPLVQGRWGLPPAGIKPGRYTFRAEEPSESTRLYLGHGVVSRFPLRRTGGRFQLTAMRNGRGDFVMSVAPPIPADQQGYGNRWRWRDWSHRLSPDGRRRAVLFRNLYGEHANDSALAVHEELRRRGSELELLWAVKDASIRLPEGAVPVLEETKAYAEAFATADYVMVNVHQPDWYSKRPGQVLVETFHGYPFKLAGRPWWKKLGFGPERIESFMRRAEEWDYLVSPAPYATGFLREFWRPDTPLPGEILEIGYPRNDALLNTDSVALREDTRSRLGIAPGTRAVLYAPTFRDYLSADDTTAKLVELFDAEQLSAALGPGYAVLLRGHPFNARAGGRRGPGGVIDVTDYPDINHLILASDIGVLDYSSLRFDYALTGKPTLFFVPDEERYFAGREGFLPYGETVFGPRIESASELLDAIRDADALRAKFEPQRQEFVARFLPLEDGKATQRLVDAVFAPRGDA